MWLHSRDPDFRAKVNTIVALYPQPPEGAGVLCVDEKTSIQATERIHPFTPARPGRLGRWEFPYTRHGTTSLLAGFDIRSGGVLHALGPTRTGDDLVAFLEKIAAAYPDKERIIIWDNLNIHHDGKDGRWTAFNARHGGKFEFVDTPLHASWVNQVEVSFSILQWRCLRLRSFRSTTELETAIPRFIERWNAGEGHPCHWVFRGYPVQEVPA